MSVFDLHSDPTDEERLVVCSWSPQSLSRCPFHILTVSASASLRRGTSHTQSGGSTATTSHGELGIPPRNEEFVPAAGLGFSSRPETWNEPVSRSESARVESSSATGGGLGHAQPMDVVTVTVT